MSYDWQAANGDELDEALEARAQTVGRSNTR
jgi:hypothetical protein